MNTRADCNEAAGAASQESAIPELTQNTSSMLEVLQSLGDLLFSLPGVDGGAINLINENGDALVTAHLQLPQDFAGIQKGYQGFQYHFGKPDINVQVFQSGVPALISEGNLAPCAELTRMRFERWKMRSLLVLPLVAVAADGNRVTIGTVSVFSQHCLLDAALGAQINTLTQQYASQIHTLWAAHRRLERDKIIAAMTANIEQFFACVIEMNSLSTMEGVYALIAEKFLQQFGFDVISILLAEAGELVPVHTAMVDAYSHLLPGVQESGRKIRYTFNPSDGQCGYVYTHDQYFLIDDVAEIMHLPMSEKDRHYLDLLGSARTLLIVPMRLNKKVIGIMSLSTLGESLALSSTDLTLVELLTAFSSTAIRNAKAHELVEQKNVEIALLNRNLQNQMVLLDRVARKDSLTGLNNFGSFEEELMRRTSEYARIGIDSALSVILFDVDHFKQFNDTYGHLAGNQVLQEVATRIRKCARDMDFVARYGGEEFVMLLPQCDLANGMTIANHIRRKISEEPFIVDAKPHTITISGGCAQFLQMEGAHDFIYRVDSAMYCAKRNGRNRIEIASETMD